MICIKSERDRKVLMAYRSIKVLGDKMKILCMEI